MSHKNKQTLNQQIYDTLQKKNGFGRSRHDDKVLGLTGQYIYSYSTMKAYIKHCNYFTDWCKNNAAIKQALGHRPRTLEECLPYVESWIHYQEERGISSYTVKLQKAALSKLYGQPFDIRTKEHRRPDIKRSREAVKRDAHFSEEKNQRLVNACRHVGFRRSELETCKANDLIQKDGQWYVCIIGKGGRYREAPVLNNDKDTLDYIKSLNGNNHVHTGADIHSYRADYATSIYKQYARPVKAIKGKKIDYTALTGKRDRNGGRIYKSAICYGRADHKGLALDRQAMLMASQALGHNREDVFANHYIRL